MPDPASSAVLLHDGELEDVQGLLERLGVSVLEPEAAADAASGGADPARPDPAPTLVAATARRALGDPACLDAPAAGPRPVRMVFAAEDSPSLRAQLRAHGVDYLVRRPIDPSALRLLLLHALYRGPERRRVSRVPSGRRVRYQAGGRKGRAVLGDLSESGGRLLHARTCAVGQRLALELPDDVSGGTLVLRARVVRAVPPGPGERGSTLALQFGRMAERTRARLRALVASGLVGAGAAAGGAAQEQRRAPRGAFRRRVVALREEADRVLMGRDLSAGGMRVDPHPGLRVGDRMRLALHGEPGTAPWIVDATVVRNDADTGMALRFEAVREDVARGLERFVSGLPPVEPLQRGELGSLGAVLGQILD